MPRKKAEPEPIDEEARAAVAVANKRKIAIREEEYLSQYDPSSVTNTDRGQIRQLATLEIQVESLQDALAQLDMTLPANVVRSKNFSDAITNLSREARLLTVALKLDRKTRQAGSASELEDYLPRLAARAKSFLSQYAIQIVCFECMKSLARTDIRTGLIIYHFADRSGWEWKSICPRCEKNEVVIHANNWWRYTVEGIEKEKQAMSNPATIEEELDD